MSKTRVPSKGVASWQELLADPQRQFVPQYSAWATAHSWEAEGLPREFKKLFATRFNGAKAELLLALPEHKVPLPGGNAASQCDVLALLKVAGQTVCAAVEGKMNEEFGPTLSGWAAGQFPAGLTAGKERRLRAIEEKLGISRERLSGHIRYQLLHRTAAAIVEAERFKTDAAAMIVQSFSSQDAWFDDFATFARLMNTKVEVGQLSEVRLPTGMPLYLGWVRGDPRYLRPALPDRFVMSEDDLIITLPNGYILRRGDDPIEMGELSAEEARLKNLLP